MFEKAALMWLYAEQPVHAGTGSGVGAIDLPIQRERVTNWPIIQPSGLKGALREFFERQGEKNQDNGFKAKVVEAFGPDSEADSLHSGAASFSEARLLLFPVRSLKGTFAYVTCPLALQRLRRDLQTLQDCAGGDFLKKNGDRPDFPFDKLQSLSDDNILVASALKGDKKPDSVLVVAPEGQKPQVVLEEFAFQAEASDALNHLAVWLKKMAPALPWLDKDHLAQRLALVSDNVFKDFVEMSTEVITRNRIDDETGTVAEGALWTEEHLPRETVLYSLVFAAKPFSPDKDQRKLRDADAVIKFLKPETSAYLWVGGNTTVGRGLVRLAFS